jgi:lambda family phage portal protein
MVSIYKESSVKFGVDHSNDPLVIDIERLANGYAGNNTPAIYQDSIWDGDKFFGGFGATQVQSIDYWTLRRRSDQLFKENLYARGLIRRLVTNEINTGLMPEASPDEQILKLPKDSLDDWTEEVENRFGLWGKNPEVCDFKAVQTWGAIQQQARQEALLSGDVLVVLHPTTYGVTSIELVSGANVCGSFLSGLKPEGDNTVIEGVECDASGKQVAFHVVQRDGSYMRIPAYGKNTGRRIAWLVYGTDKRMNEVRGTPLLGLILQSLKEIDRYRDSTQRKAVINSILAMYIKKTQQGVGTLPTQNSAIRKDQVTVVGESTGTRQFNLASQIPGVVYEELATGEEPVGFNSQGVDLNFGAFEESMIQAIAWANQIPPEILKLSFSNNYSASQAAINEFKIYLNMVWSSWGESFCTPIYTDWLMNEVLRRRIKADGLIDSFRSVDSYDIWGAWTTVDWYGSIKPSTDMLKQAKGSVMLVENGWSTNARESRITTGTKFSKNIKRLMKENNMLAEMRRPMLELEKEIENVGKTVVEGGRAITVDDVEAIVTEVIEDHAK